jgi:hypothetical protein
VKEIVFWNVKEKGHRFFGISNGQALWYHLDKKSVMAFPSMSFTLALKNL